jgi:hypothetical protein
VNLDQADRVPACVQVCPVSARHFGDLGDPHSAVSELVAARGGVDLMPEMGYHPVNKYLPPRQPVRLLPDGPSDDAQTKNTPIANPLLRWIDRMLTT